MYRRRFFRVFEEKLKREAKNEKDKEREREWEGKGL